MHRPAVLKRCAPWQSPERSTILYQSRGHIPANERAGKGNASPSRRHTQARLPACADSSPLPAVRPPWRYARLVLPIALFQQCPPERADRQFEPRNRILVFEPPRRACNLAGKPVAMPHHTPRTLGPSLSISSVTAHTSASTLSGECPSLIPSAPNPHISSSSAVSPGACRTRPCA